MMKEVTRPVELTDEELELVAAGHGALLDVDVDVKNNNIAVLNNIAVASAFFKQTQTNY